MEREKAEQNRISAEVEDYENAYLVKKKKIIF